MVLMLVKKSHHTRSISHKNEVSSIPFSKIFRFWEGISTEKEPPRVGIRMGFLIAKHILYSGKTMDQTNEILFIQEKKRDCKPGISALY